MNRLYLLLITLLICSSVFAQNIGTKRDSILNSLDDLRSEIKTKFDNGEKKRVYYYNNNNEFVSVANFSEDGKIYSIYSLDKGIKKEYLKFYSDSGSIKEHSYYHSNKKIKLKIFYDQFKNIESTYFYSPEGKQRFEIIFDLVNGGYSKRIFDSNGNLRKKITYDKGIQYISYEYNGKTHGWITTIDSEGKETKEKFMNQGFPSEFYEGWEKIIMDYDKIPEYEKQLEAELTKYGITLNNSTGKGKGIN